jgi:hypothetical protein
MNSTYLEYSIVLVPGIGTVSPENWPFANKEWLSTLPSSGAGARILSYKYSSPFTGTKFSWESILMLGYDLLQQLNDARSQSNPDSVSELVIIPSHWASGMHAEVPSVDHQQANPNSLSQFGWYYS